MLKQNVDYELIPATGEVLSGKVRMDDTLKGGFLGEDLC